LDDEDMGRQLVELGYRGSGDTLRREDFEARKKMLHEKSNQKTNLPRQLASMDKDLNNFPFLQALATREELVRTGNIIPSSISYTRIITLIIHRKIDNNNIFT